MDKAQAAIQFSSDSSTWEGDKDYQVWKSSRQGDDPAMKFEKVLEFGQDGFYDYVFENTTDKDADLGAYATSCTCSSIEVCVLNDQQRDACRKAVAARKAPLDSVGNITWQPLPVDREMGKSIVVPAGATGVVRVHWHGPHAEAELGSKRIHLTVDLWNRVAKSGDQRSSIKLSIYLVYLQPAMFTPDELMLGTINTREKTTEKFVCWSATRDFQILPSGGDKHLSIDVVPLTASERKEFAKDLPFPLHAAYRVGVTLFEQVDGKQLPIGPIARPVPVQIAAGGAELVHKTPIIKAYVLGPVRLATVEDQGRINFQPFAASKGARREVILLAPEGWKVRCNNAEQELAGVTGELKELNSNNNGETRWQLVVTVAPKSREGLFPENAVLMLQVEIDKARWRAPLTGAWGAAATLAGESQYRPRMVRIPITGTAESR